MLAILRTENQRQLGLLLAFGSLMCGGTYNALAKGLTPFLSPLSLLLISEALTALFIIITLGLVPLLKQLSQLKAKTLLICLFIGLINSALAPLLWFQGLSMTSAVNASILAPAGLLTALLGGKWLLGEKVSRNQAIGAATIIGGILVVNLTSHGTAFRLNAGDGLIFIATQLFALGMLLFKKYLNGVQPELSIMIRNVVGITVVIVTSLFVHDAFIFSEFSAFPAQLVLSLLAFVFFARYLNLAFYYEALARLPVTALEMVEIASPLSGMVFAAALLGENIGLSHVFGGLLIVLGLLIEQTSSKSFAEWKEHVSLFRLFHYKRPMDGMLGRVSKHA